MVMAVEPNRLPAASRTASDTNGAAVVRISIWSSFPVMREPPVAGAVLVQPGLDAIVPPFV
jgi:hypothetical protein